MRWDEACSLFRRLCLDPSSHVASSIAWQTRHLPAANTEPVERIFTIDAYVLADLYDALIHHKVYADAYPRPSDPPKKQPSLSQTVIRAALAARGH